MQNSDCTTAIDPLSTVNEVKQGRRGRRGRREDILAVYSDSSPALRRRRLDGLNRALEIPFGRNEVGITPVQQQDSAQVEDE
jgi:hypothetical protein